MTSRISRTVVGLASVLFAAVALGLWVIPEQVAHRFGLAATGSDGLVTLRADLAGLFAGMIVARPCERTRCVGGKPAEEAPANGLRVETESGAHLRVDTLMR